MKNMLRYLNGRSLRFFLIFKCQILLKVHIIKKIPMLRQRKKVVIEGKDKRKTVVVDSETDEVEQ